MVRCVGWYTNRVRGEPAKAFTSQDPHFGERRVDESIVSTNVPIAREPIAIR